jgi:hypothetical protein
MKRLLMLQVLAFSLVCILGISSASALGLGAYYNQGWGDGEVEYDDWDDDDYNHYDFDDIDIENDYKTRMIGFMLDTNVARDSIFNYRLNIALDEMEPKSGKDIDGYVMDHTFGFGVLRNQNVRLWIGPQINLSYYTDDDFDMFGLGFGPAIGVNIHAGDKISFTVTSGYKYNFLIGSEDRYDDDFDFTGYEGQYYINFGVLFRINDVYQQ